MWLLTGAFRRCYADSHPGAHHYDAIVVSTWPHVAAHKWLHITFPMCLDHQFRESLPSEAPWSFQTMLLHTFTIRVSHTNPVYILAICMTTSLRRSGWSSRRHVQELAGLPIGPGLYAISNTFTATSHHAAVSLASCKGCADGIDVLCQANSLEPKWLRC